MPCVISASGKFKRIQEIIDLDKAVDIHWRQMNMTEIDVALSVLDDIQKI